MNALLAEHYRKRAIDFGRGMELIGDDADYRWSCALLAIHSSIGYADALRTALGEESLYAEDHRQALASLRRLLIERHLEDVSGYSHFEYLLSMKSFVAYGDRWLDESRSRRIALAAQRFVAWSLRIARKLKMEGWTDES